MARYTAMHAVTWEAVGCCRAFWRCCRPTLPDQPVKVHRQFPAGWRIVRREGVAGIALVSDCYIRRCVQTIPGMTRCLRGAITSLASSGRSVAGLMASMRLSRVKKPIHGSALRIFLKRCCRRWGQGKRFVISKAYLHVIQRLGVSRLTYALPKPFNQEHGLTGSLQV